MSRTYESWTTRTDRAFRTLRNVAKEMEARGVPEAAQLAIESAIDAVGEAHDAITAAIPTRNETPS